MDVRLPLYQSRLRKAHTQPTRGPQLPHRQYVCCRTPVRGGRDMRTREGALFTGEPATCRLHVAGTTNLNLCDQLRMKCAPEQSQQTSAAGVAQDARPGWEKLIGRTISGATLCHWVARLCHFNNSRNDEISSPAMRSGLKYDSVVRRLHCERKTASLFSQRQAYSAPLQRNLGALVHRALRRTSRSGRSTKLKPCAIPASEALMPAAGYDTHKAAVPVRL